MEFGFSAAERRQKNVKQLNTKTTGVEYTKHETSRKSETVVETI